MQQLTESQLQELRVNFAFWRAIEMVAGRAYPKTDAFNLIVADAFRFGAPDVRSAWARACHEAVQSGKVRLNSPVQQPVEIDQAFRDEVQRMPSSELLRCINRDPVFKAKFDVLSQETAAQRQPDADNYSSFQAADWRTLAPATLARLMTKPSFRKRIDELAAAGSI